MPFMNESQIEAFLHWNYTYQYANGTAYANGTVSNASRCYMIREPYIPQIWFHNGSIIAGTSCSQPIDSIKSHGITGIVFAILFLFLLPFCIAALKRHGKRAYSAASIVYPYGKRWEFYWQIITVMVIMISAFFCIDIDRSVVQGSSFGAYGLFWAASFPLCLAAVWELSRNWGQIQNDRYREDHPEMALKQHEERLTTKIGFWMPLLFYAMDFISCFLMSFRSWTGVIDGNINVATDGRFKAGAIFSVLAYLVIFWIILNTVYAYRPNLRTLHFGVVVFSMVILLPRLFYCNFQMYHYKYSAWNPDVDVVWTIVFGYLPVFFCFASHNYRGLMMQNVDKLMLEERKEKEREWQRTLKKTYDPSGHGGTTINSSYTLSGMKRSDIAADWIKNPFVDSGNELKNFTGVVERKLSDF